VSNPTSNGTVLVRLVQYRFDSPDELLTWTYSHRFIRELTCVERATYHLEPGCDAAGVYPTSTPYIPPTSPTLFAATQAPAAGPTATTTPTVTPRPVLTAQVGENRGEVAIGSYQVWHYTGRAGETLRVSASADVPCNGATDNDHCLDTLLTVVGPHGELLSVGWGNGILMSGANDVEPGVNSDSQISDLALPYDGDYTIEVSGFHFKTGGAYTLTIESTPSAAATPTPETPSGS
jgi:hypothetical protein